MVFLGNQILNLVLEVFIVTNHSVVFLRDVYLHPTLKSYTTGAPSLFSSIKLFSESSVDQSWHWIGGNAVERVSIEAFSSRCANALANSELDALMGEAK